jgi:hypothetical protein
MEDQQKLEFLRRVAEAGDKADMWKTGEAQGLNRDATETLCMDFFAQGILEVVSLSGAVRLTDSGREGLGEAPGGGGPDSLASLVADLEKAGDLGLKPPASGDLMADLACLKAQTKRSQPLTQVVKACLLAVEAALMQSPAAQAEALAQRAAGLRG